MTNPDQVVSKSEFAKLCNVTPANVTHWIRDGKLSEAALVGDGRSARIRVDVALRQVNLRRDVGQALGNGIGTRLASPRPGPSVAEGGDDEDPLEGWPADGSGDAIDRKLKAAKLEAAERVNRVEAVKEAASQGIYTETGSVRAEMGKIAGQMMRIFEGALPEIATAIAAEFRIEARDVTHALNEQFRKVREQAAAAAAQHASLLPDAIDTPA